MTVFLGDNIISALGFTSAENYLNVKNGVSGLKFLADRYNLPEPFMASEIDDLRLNAAFEQCSSDFAAMGYPCSKAAVSLSCKKVNYTKLEKACIVSVAEALKDAGVKGSGIEGAIDPSGNRVLFILSTTKGNVFLLDENEQQGYEHNQLYLWRSAELISQFFGNTNTPLVVSNACISGAFALVAAQRELRSGKYDYVIVVGADVLSKFIVTGFQAFKALSQEVCKPFDANRTGLNIGEAVASVVMTECGGSEAENNSELTASMNGFCEKGFKKGDIVLTAGAVRNDANHISGPSRTGEGSYLALRSVLEGVDLDEIAFVCAHGTATPYNDEMESVSMTRAGLQNVPTNSLKGYFGHTLGAAGILESVVSMQAIKDEMVVGTYGFETLGVTNPLRMVRNVEKTTKPHFVKMLSGFGGCNVAALFTKY